MFWRSQRIPTTFVALSANHPFPSRPARRTASLLARARLDAGDDDGLGECGEMGLGIGLGCYSPDGPEISARILGEVLDGLPHRITVVEVGMTPPEIDSSPSPDAALSVTCSALLPDTEPAILAPRAFAVWADDFFPRPFGGLFSVLHL